MSPVLSGDAAVVPTASADLSGQDVSDARGRPLILILLCTVGFFNFMDRQAIAVLIEPIKHEFRVSDSLIGLLTGLTFAGFYTISSIPIGRLADRTSRKAVLAACLLFWSLCTLLAGFAQSFAQLAATRIGVAVGESGGTPISHAIIAERYPQRQRASALAIFSGTQATGIGTGILLGGVLAQTLGWRAVFWILGAPGILLAAIVWKAIPSASTASRSIANGNMESFSKVAGFLWGIAEFRRAIFVSGLASLTGYGMLNWGPTFFIRVHGLQPAQVGLAFGLVYATALVFGSVATGLIADRAARHGFGGYMRVASIGLLLGAPAAAVAFSVSNPSWAFVALFAAFSLQIANLAPCLAIIQAVAPPTMRAQASVIFGLGQALFGLGLAPAVIGVLNDLLSPALGTDAIRYSLIINCSGAILAGVLAAHRGWFQPQTSSANSVERTDAT
jgi:predicted MFS family arabinose efflux permease